MLQIWLNDGMNKTSSLKMLERRYYFGSIAVNDFIIYILGGNEVY
jgi:hypothetical protein